MHHYPNGQRPPQDQQHQQDSYNRRPASYYQSDDYTPQDVSALPASAQSNHNYASARQPEDLFIATPGHQQHFTSMPEPPSTYNPQVYSNSTALPLSQGYASTARRPSYVTASPQPYNPADYVDVSLAQAGYNTGVYQPGYPTTTPQATMPAMPSATLYHTQSSASSRPYSAYNRPSMSTSSYSPQPNFPRLHYSSPAPPPLPAIPGSAELPSADWDRLPDNSNNPMRYNSVRPRYDESDVLTLDQSAAAPPPPPAYQSHGSRGSSRSNSHPPTPGPPPPPHSSIPRFNFADQYSHSRPLPQVPPSSSSPAPDYFPLISGVGRNDRSSDASSAQANLELQISGMLHSSRIEDSGDCESDDTDPEALAGLEAMREADRQDQEDEARRQSRQVGFGWHPSAQEDDAEYLSQSDGDIPYEDLDSIGGGFDAHTAYGGNPDQLVVGRHESAVARNESHSSQGQPVSSSGSQRRSGMQSEADTTYDEYGSLIHPFPPFSAARVDAVGTGGLADPTISRNRRLSYDEGDEAPLTDQSYLVPGEPPEMFYHPGMTSRPLPQPPLGELRHTQSSSAVPYPSDWHSSQQLEFPRAPSFPPPVNYYQPTGLTQPNRHQSLVSHASTPQTLAPIRAKTDAEERRRQQRQSGTFSNESTAPNSAAASAVALDLPSLEKKFNPAKLRSREFDRCREPWALSAISDWLRQMAEGEQYLKKQPLIDGLVALFTYKVPTMNVADAETLGEKLIEELEASGALKQEEEWLLFTHEPVSGVIFQLTGTGCYSPKLHDHHISLRCYSYHCQRTEKKIDLSSQQGMKSDEDWATYYKLEKADIEGHDKKEIERQNILHEIVQKEENYLRELDVVRQLYRDQLKNANPPLIPPQKLNSFVNQVFGKVDSVKRSNEEHLLPQMKYRQGEQGPWVVGFSDIFREWIRKAKAAYVDYASSYPNAVYKIRQEMERNVLFRTFLDKCQADPVSRRLGWDHYLKLPISRLQQVGLLLDTALRKSVQDSDEKRNLQIAIEEIKAVTHECDSRVGEGQRKADLSDLQYKLKLRPGMQGRVELNLDHLGRELIHKGDLLRIGTSKFTWHETHAILFDHYLVLAKIVTERVQERELSSKYEGYDVSRLPIPMDLLVIESRDDDPVIRSGLTGRAGVAKVTPTIDPRLARTTSIQSSMPGQLTHNNTSTSLISLATIKSNSSAPPVVTNLESTKDDRTLFPFKIKHLGQDTYTLYAPTLQSREDWCNKIIEAKTKHAAALFAQNAEPFRLRVVADSAFAYDGSVTGQRAIVIKGTPLDRAIRDVEKMYATKGRPGPVCRSKVNCATAFNQPFGKQMVAIGTDFGVYVSELDNPRGWQRVISNPKVTQVAVLEDFSLFLLISDKALIAYHLDVVCPVGGVPPANDNARRAPQKLSGSRDVGFFTTGKMKERTLVMYKKRDGISSTFKVIIVLEPVFQKATEKKSRFPPLRSGKTEFFRDFDEFYIPTECMGMNMFHSSLAVSTQKGFEVLTLDKKQPISIPNLDAPHVQAINQKLSGQKPLGMFRLSDQEFLLVYDECAVYVNKNGDISRSVIMEFVGKARSVALYGPYVLLFDPDFVEIRNAQNGRLRQVIWGRDVKCLDDALVGGTAGARTVKLSMQHPEVERVQIVVELVINEGLRE